MAGEQQLLLDGALHVISAAAGLGTAAMGLVDATKAFGGGPSNFGFDKIDKALERFLKHATGAFGRDEAMETLKANWLNGMPKADQKTRAKALVHLFLTTENAGDFAAAAGVKPALLQGLAEKIASGATASAEEINALGQFDAVLSAVLDAAYEHADQNYRNGSKLLALAFSTVLGVIGGWFIVAEKTGSLDSYLFTPNFWTALLVGVIATPLAPVAKDLTTSLQAAVAAVRATKR
jgi:hypothetical protein